MAMVVVDLEKDTLAEMACELMEIGQRLQCQVIAYIYGVPIKAGYGAPYEEVMTRLLAEDRTCWYGIPQATRFMVELQEWRDAQKKE